MMSTRSRYSPMMYQAELPNSVVTGPDASEGEHFQTRRNRTSLGGLFNKLLCLTVRWA
jgi:hypothetical protein